MLFFIFLIICLISFMFFGYAITKRKCNPITVINVVYLTWLIIGRIGYLGQFVPSFESSFFIQINVLIIDIFIAIGYCVKKRIILHIAIKINSDKLFMWIRRISFAISMAVLFRMVIGLFSGHLLLSNVRNISYSVAFGTMDYAQIYYNSGIYYIYQYLVRGFAFFDLSYSYARLLKNEEKIPLLSIANFILFIIIMQSRFELMKIVLFLLIYSLFANVQLSDFQKKVLKRVLIVLGIAVIVLLSFRTINTEKSVILNTFDSFIVDFSGSNYMFSEYFAQFCQGDRLIDSPIILKYMGGFGLLIEYVLRIIGIFYDHSIVNSYLGRGHYIGSSNHYNAFYTMFFEFMNSGGFVGCIIFSIIIGFVVGKLYRTMTSKNSIKSIYIAAFAVYIVAMGTYNYVISGIYAVMIMTCIFIAKDFKTVDSGGKR